MAQYCNSQKLDTIWESWQLSRETPDLELVRDSGLLWTRRCGDDMLLHCTASENDFWFVSINGSIHSSDIILAFKSSTFEPDYDLISELSESEFIYEQDEIESWNELVHMIIPVVTNISKKFNPRNEDEKFELIQEALYVILDKINRGILKMKKGKAPSFNLLTTAIINAMRSIKNKENRIKTKDAKIFQGLINSKWQNRSSYQCQQSLANE